MPNMLDCYVTEVVSPPTYREGWTEGSLTIPEEWLVDVHYTSHGYISPLTLRFATWDEAAKVTPGYHFQEMF